MTATEKFVGFDILKRSVTMVQVLDRYGLLDRLHRSGDSLTGVCPIHVGHNPTQFRVSVSKNCWICFGDCHRGGSIVDFVSRKEGVGIREAALLIQNWFNVAPGPNGNGGSDAHKPANRVADSAPEPPGQNRRLGFTLGPLDDEHPYLDERGLTAETIINFGLGYCSRGLLNGWIAIPIHSSSGQLVAYAGRWPGEPPAGTPKYRLPRGFRKSLEVFNLHRARTTEVSQPLVVVEGFFGCMSVWQAGYRRVVSIMGSQLSTAQEALIVSTVGPQGKVILLFDEDPAGRNGCADARSRLARSVVVTVVRLERECMQPDKLPPAQLLELLRNGGRYAN